MLCAGTRLTARVFGCAEYLAQSGLPLGIQEAMLESLEEFPLRIWIIDNSGSMSTRDGTYLEQSGRSERMVDCTRWQELGASIQWHATMAAHLAAPTEFRLLNPPGGGSLQVLQCGVGPEPTSEIREVEKMLHTSPKSTTPLCAQIRAVVERVKQEEQVRQVPRPEIIDVPAKPRNPHHLDTIEGRRNSVSAQHQADKLAKTL